MFTLFPWTSNMFTFCRRNNVLLRRLRSGAATLKTFLTIFLFRCCPVSRKWPVGPWGFNVLLCKHSSVYRAQAHLMHSVCLFGLKSVGPHKPTSTMWCAYLMCVNNWKAYWKIHAGCSVCWLCDSKNVLDGILTVHIAVLQFRFCENAM